MEQVLRAAGLVLIIATLVRPLAAQFARDVPLGLDAFMPVPEDNPLTPEKVALGRRLFFDRRLSADGTVSCATCHDPERAFTDGRRVAVGVGGRTGKRNAPALINRGYGAAFFWDGRAPSLEEQVLKPIQDPNEMGLPLSEASARTGLSADDISRGLATYIRSLLAGDSRADQFHAGHPHALSPEQQEGLKLFRGKANCTACHLGPTFSDERFHNTGIAWMTGSVTDIGRAAVTGRLEDRGAFKTATLRHVTDTAPYMHDGSFDRLEDVIDFYDRGGHPNPHLDPEMRPLRLNSEEKAALVEFLRALSGRIIH